MKINSNTKPDQVEQDFLIVDVIIRVYDVFDFKLNFEKKSASVLRNMRGTRVTRGTSGDQGDQGD